MQAPISFSRDGSIVTVTLDGAIATVTLSNPGKLNALSVAHWQSLQDTMRRMALEAGLRVIVVRGAEGNFAAGADIAEFQTVRANVADARAITRRP